MYVCERGADKKDVQRRVEWAQRRILCAVCRREIHQQYRECRMYRLCGRKIFHRYVFFNIFVF